MRDLGWADDLLRRARVAHLATATRHGIPYLIPVCFVFDGKTIYTPIDYKPKRGEPERLRRIINILENPQVSFLADHYSEDWRKLRYVLIRGTAKILRAGKEHTHAIKLFRGKYTQYRNMRLEERPVIKIRPRKFTIWSFRKSTKKH